MNSCERYWRSGAFLGPRKGDRKWLFYLSLDDLLSCYSTCRIQNDKNENRGHSDCSEKWAFLGPRKGDRKWLFYLSLDDLLSCYSTCRIQNDKNENRGHSDYGII